jgi:formamidopyrimidine-DNA glycosylase
MPELPEVQTTVTGLKKLIGLKIIDCWSNYHVGSSHGYKNNIKNRKYFLNFRKKIIGQKISSIRRRGKNVLIDLSRKDTILIHLKMTGHLLYGTYIKNRPRKTDKPSWENEYWIPKEKNLLDPFNKWVHLVFSMSNGKTLVLSDVRRFAKIILLNSTKEKGEFEKLGPDPLKIDSETFEKQIRKKPSGKIKTVLMNQELISGIGNIYSDEILWYTGVHPEITVSKITDSSLRKIFNQTRKILKKSISLGGDSDSDYRKIDGSKGSFQKHHRVYGKKGLACDKKGCRGIIQRIVIGGRSAHFCPKHQQIKKG